MFDFGDAFGFFGSVPRCIYRNGAKVQRSNGAGAFAWRHDAVGGVTRGWLCRCVAGLRLVAADPPWQKGFHFEPGRTAINACGPGGFLMFM